MKPPRDDETNWDQLVASGIMGPEFQAAWETLKGSGIGSTEGTSREKPDPWFRLAPRASPHPA